MNTIAPSSRYSVPQKSASLGMSSCPHGAAIGACPYCSMGGGGGGGGGKPKSTAGLMTWNEAYAVWKSIQNAKQFAEDNARLLNTAAQNRAQENRQALQTTGMMTAVTRIMQMANGFIAGLMRSGSAQAANKAEIADTQAGTLEQLRNRAKVAMEKTVVIADKLAAIIGEELKLLRDNLRARIEKIMRQILNGQFALFVTIVAEIPKKVFEAFFARPLRTVRQKISSSFKKLFKFLLRSSESDLLLES